MSSTDEIVSILIERQKAEGVPDGRFADRLGVSRPAWHAFKHGHRRPNRQSLQHIVRAYPDLTVKIVALFLPDESTNVNHESQEAKA